MARAEISPWSLRAAYLFAALLAISPLADFLRSVWPIRPLSLDWRYGFLGIGAGFLHTPILGILIAMTVAHFQGHNKVLRVVGGLSTTAGLLLIPVLLEWPLDVVAVRAIRSSDANSILLTGLVQEIRYLGACLVLVGLGAGALRTAGATRQRPPSASMGIVGRR